MVLIVQAIIGGEIETGERSRLMSSLDVLTLSLEQLAQWWQFCNSMVGEYRVKEVLEMTDNPILGSLAALRKQAFTPHDFNDIYQLLSVLQGPFNPRHTTFLKPSDYQISRSERHYPTQPQDSALWGLPHQNIEGRLSDAAWDDVIWQGISFDTETNPGGKELR